MGAPTSLQSASRQPQPKPKRGSLGRDVARQQSRAGAALPNQWPTAGASRPLQKRCTLTAESQNPIGGTATCLVEQSLGQAVAFLRHRGRWHPEGRDVSRSPAPRDDLGPCFLEARSPIRSAPVLPAHLVAGLDHSSVPIPGSRGTQALRDALETPPGRRSTWTGNGHERAHPLPPSYRGARLARCTRDGAGTHHHGASERYEIATRLSTQHAVH